MNPNEIKKALECHIKGICNDCTLQNTEHCMRQCYENALAYINQLESERDDLYFKLVGVMHFVDKWLDDDQLNQHEVNRAETMREKTLQIVEKLQAEVERLNVENLQMIARIKHLRANAIKEFGKFLIDKSINGVISISDMPEYVKEMVGDE